jgi:hypothetical protein
MSRKEDIGAWPPRKLRSKGSNRGSAVRVVTGKDSAEDVKRRTAMLERGDVFGQKLCAALGLDASHVRNLRLVIKPDAVVTAHVVMYVDKEQALRVQTLVQDYELVKRDRILPTNNASGGAGGKSRP